MSRDSDLVVIVAPCPAAAPAVEGWMSRIHMVDSIFAKSRRVYLDPITGVGGFEDTIEKRHNRLVSEYRIDLQIPQHRRVVEDLIRRCRLVYVHTCHLARYFLPYYATGKIITDMHGIVPEEEDLQNRPEHGLFYQGVERIVLANSRKLVVVSDAMKLHLLEKHPDSHAEFLVMPIIENHAADLRARVNRSEGAKYRVIYSGGTQAWQNIDATVELCKSAADFCTFRFLSQEHERIRSLFGNHSIARTGYFGLSSKRDLGAHYLNADFGLVLRDDIAVNRVSCPTKLTEYLWFGIVPIVRSTSIGDFESGGYGYVTEDEFRIGLIPDELQLERMRQKNWQIVSALAGRFDTVKSELAALKLPNAIHGNDFYGLPISNDYLIYPGFAELYLVGDQTSHHKKPVIGAYQNITFEVPPQKAKTLRYVPYLERIGIRLKSVEIFCQPDDNEDVHVASIHTAGTIRRDWIFLDRRTPFVDLCLTEEVVVKSVRFEIEFCSATIEDLKTVELEQPPALTTINRNGRRHSRRIAVQHVG